MSASSADASAESYRDARGNDRDELVRMLRGYFIANQRIEIVSRVDEIVLEGADAARAVCMPACSVSDRAPSCSAGVDADLYRFELELVNDGGEWQIIGADCEQRTGRVRCES